MMEGRGRVLVTGAAGFIGSRLCEALSSRGWDVLGIDNINDYYDPRLKYARLQRMGVGNGETAILPGQRLNSSAFHGLSFERADITDRDSMERLFSNFRPTAVMNLAAQAGVRYSIENPYTYIHNNIDGFIVLLECARHYPVERFVYASSSSVYGGNEKVPFSESDTVDNPVSLYAATKKSNEMMARAYHNLYGIPAIGLRFFTVYGPWGRPDMAPMIFARAIDRGERIKVFNGGNVKRDFTYIDDIVDGVVRVMEGEGEISIENDLYNIGYGSPVDIPHFIQILENEMSCTASKDYLPMQQGDVTRTYANTSRLSEDYGYSPSTSIEEGIRHFVEWYRSDDNPLR